MFYRRLGFRNETQHKFPGLSHGLSLFKILTYSAKKPGFYHDFTINTKILARNPVSNPRYKDVRIEITTNKT